MQDIGSEIKKSSKASAFTLIVAFISVALVGLALVPLLPVKLNPSRTLPGFSVWFGMGGTSARVVEMTATSKLEAMLARVKGIQSISSTSGNGWGSINVSLDKHADAAVARFEASTIIRQTWPELPAGVSYPYIQMASPEQKSQGPFIAFTINAPATPSLIQKYAEEHIKTRLAQLPGIYKINVSGATPMEWRLEYDYEQLRALGVSTDEISQAVGLHYQKEFLGTYDVEQAASGKEWIRLVLMPEHDNREFDAGQIQVKVKDGRIIRLDELVKVVRMEEQPQSYYRINGLNSIYLSVVAEEAANQLELSKKVQACMDDIRLSLPAGYEIHTSYDTTEFIHDELNKIYLRTGVTVAILLLFVLLITFSPKYLFLIVTSLTVNMAIAVIFYYVFGLEMQLYSLAGITVSLNLVIDNTIVMSDHYLRCKNRKAFMSVLAATLTTMGALVIIFFLDERIRLNLQDFAAVVMINLGVSLLVALFFVPSLIDKIGLKRRRKSSLTGVKRKWKMGNTRFLGWLRSKMRRGPVYFSHFYRWLIQRLCRWRVAVCLLLLLAFGLPVFLLPEKMDGDGKWAEIYNKTLGTPTYKEKVKPIVDKALGGSLRLFVQKVYEGSYFTRNEEVVLYANVNLPSGSTLEQMNTLIKRMETYLSEFKEIKQFQTSVESARRASISIRFTKENQKSGFPYTLKANMISKALQLGGGDWSIYGLQDQGFSNSVRENAGSFRVKMYGYNYDELYSWATKLKEVLLSHRRIREVTVGSNFSWWKDDYQEFYFELDKQRMIGAGIGAGELFAAIRPIYGRNQEIGSVVTEDGTEKIKLSSRQSDQRDIWAMQYYPFRVGDKEYKLAELAKVEKGQMPQEVAKENQQYRLCLQYEYIGASEQGNKLLKKDLEEFNELLPMGYKAEAESNNWSWGGGANKQYRLLLIVIAIIFFITSILFNSLKQPLAIIFVIPISYIGVFLTFYWFKLNFDQGGFASFILLCGITVNASIYILNEYNAIRKRFPCLSSLRAYVKAWNTKVIPIFLTVVSTILGFIPFMVGAEKEGFWFPLAAGTIGGLVMSVIGVFIFLPVLTLNKKKMMVKKP